MAIRSILLPYFVAIFGGHFGIFFPFGILYPEKSGNPEA
jgi:hypothetical protein